ncbi:YIF1-domain-containing protein [Tricholoma matsutake]|nr:YIF1-domain-containing protein [Tricholoma matsutake 945]KAF8237474.1 YIF1-domain-containing protein [Tricholoma matsutake 945]
MSNFVSSHSPPPLRHPVPTHPAYIPEPPPTPLSPQGYQRYSSSPSIPSLGPSYVPAYTTPFQQQQQPIHHAPIPQPDFAAWGMNDATAQFGMQLGHSAVAAGQDYVQRNFGTMFPSTTIKHHFNVSNSYVIHKIKLVLFPWTHKPWSRRLRRSEQGQSEWQNPREDINSPDLYIPAMAVVTYILLCALHAGLQKQFHTKVLGDSASRAIAVVLLDLAFVKLGCYFLNVQGQSQFVDLIAYGGYKFVGVIFTLIATLSNLTRVLWTLVFIYAFFANAFFLLRSLRSVFLPDSSISLSTNPNPTTTATINPAQRRRRITFLFFEAVCQVLYMWILVRI